MARPTKMTPEVLEKLRQAYLIGATNAEACGYADIGERTLYDYLAENEEFSQKIDQWKNEPILKAKTMVVKNLDKDIKNAQWYLERKKKDEFAVRQEHTGADGNAIQAIIDKFGSSEGVDEVPPITTDEKPTSEELS